LENQCAIHILKNQVQWIARHTKKIMWLCQLF